MAVLPAASPGIETLHVATLADRQWGTHEDFDKILAEPAHEPQDASRAACADPSLGRRRAIERSQRGVADLAENFANAPKTNAGFPFFVPGVAGHRPPTPPLDIVDGAARIVDPIMTGVNTGAHVWGQFLKDYRAVPW